MEVYYRREIQHNYLIIEPDECQGWSYEVKMLLHNPIEGLLKFRMKLVDGEQQFFYEITSKQPLSRVLENRSITAEEIRKLVVALASILNKIEPFLLMPHQILLQAEYIYLEPESFQLYFCLVPGRNSDFSKDLQELLYYLLKKVDHQNQESVVLAYGLYQETQKENYGIGNLMKFMNLNSAEKQENASVNREHKLQEELHRCDTYETWETCDTELPEMGEQKNSMQVKTDKLKKRDICLFTWIFLICGIGIIYVWRGPEFLWQKKEILAGIFAVLILISIITGYTEYSEARKEKNQKSTGVKKDHAEAGAENRNDVNETEITAITDIRANTKTDEKSDIKTDVKIQKESRNKIKTNDTKRSKIKEEKWQILFQEEQENMEKAEENVLQTTVLPMVKKTGEGHYLMSLQDGYENILLSYFPFIIGKAEHMADYVIPKSSVSRMHAKIERTENGYQITDLNSTNGTWVGEHQLEANETFPLKINDKIRLSDLFFCFK